MTTHISVRVAGPRTLYIRGLPPGLHTWVRKSADQCGLSMSEFVGRVLAMAREDYDPVKVASLIDWRGESSPPKIPEEAS